MSTKSRLELIKEAARKYKEEQEFQQAVATVDARRKAAKKLTKSVKKAAHQAPGHTDCFKDENRYWSSEETRDYIQGTSYFENYQSMKNDWD